jgi:UDP-glucose 4-epimerase
MSNSSPRPTVLITGATGALGPAVIRAFDASGWRIRTLSRNPPAAGSAAAAHEHFCADITDAVALRAAMTDVDTVVHMAALLHVLDRSASLGQYERVNVEGTKAVMAAATAASVGRVVALSTIAVYGPHTSMIDETTPPAPDTPYGVTKLQGEYAALQARGADDRSLAAVLRLAAVYGPGVKGNYERLVRALARRRFVPIGDGSNARTLVFEDDAAEAILLAATHPAAAGGIFNVTDGAVHRVRDIVGAIARALGRRPPRLRVPASMAIAGVRAVESALALAGRRSPVTRTTLDKYLEHVAVSGRRIGDTLLFHPRWTLDSGWQRTVDQLRREGRL